MGNIGNTAAPVDSQFPDDFRHIAEEITEEFFTWIPDAQRAATLARVSRQFWRFRASSAVAVAAQGLGQSMDNLIGRIESVDLDRPLAPRLSGRLSGLMELMERRDGYGVFDALQAWVDDPKESWPVTGIAVESIASHDWERFLLREVRSTQIPGGSHLEFFPLLERDLSATKTAIADALHSIEQAHSGMHAEILSHVSLIKFFTGNGIEGLSSPKVFGAIWLKMPPPDQALAWFLEHLVHECSHLYLNALFLVDPLLENPQELNKAPIRPDPRPMFQILHGTFVLARNCCVHARLERLFPELDLRPSLERFRTQFQNGMEVLEKHMQPTESGQWLLDSMKQDG
jgi:hypothetical protein